MHSMSISSSTVLFFLKQPVSGQVKSRLAAVLGGENALRLYRAFVEDMLATIDGAGLAHRVCVHPPAAIPAVASWLGHHRRYLSQEGEDLGERMANAFRGIFAEGISRAVLIGSDLPDLPAHLLTEALDVLGRHDAVIGPARDGGYYLIGFRRETFLPDAFPGIAWGGADVFEHTMERFRASGAGVHVLPTWNDVDTIEDLRDLVQRSRGAVSAAHRTVRVIQETRPAEISAEGPHA
jgi:hypothetical protein